MAGALPETGCAGVPTAINSYAGRGFVIWGSLVGPGYFVGAALEAGLIYISVSRLLTMWCILLSIGWILSFLDGFRIARKDHGKDVPAVATTAASMCGGIVFSLYFVLSLLANTFESHTMWLVTVSQFATSVFVTALVVRQKWLLIPAWGWIALFAFGTTWPSSQALLDGLAGLACLTLLAIPGFLLHRIESDKSLERKPSTPA